MAAISPEILRTVRRIQIRTNRTVSDLLAGAYQSAFKGKGMEFEDVRAYQPGDEIRSIDWNVTARMNHTFVKNFREERELTVMLVVDASGSSRFGTTGKQRNELIAEIGALLSFSAMSNNDKVGMILFSDRVEKYLPPKKGMRHALRLIRELLAFEPKNQQTDMNGALNFLSKVQKRRGVCFLISDFITDPAKRELALTAKRHDLTAVCVTDPREREIPSMGLVHLRDLESGETLLVDTSRREVREALKENTLTRLRECEGLMQRIGAGFVSVDTDGCYHEALRQHFHRRERRR